MSVKPDRGMGRTVSTIVLFSVLALGGCPGPEDRGGRTESGESDLYSHQLPAGVELTAEENGRIPAVSALFAPERGGHPALRDLREREALDAVIAPGRDEFERMVLLCDWANSQFPAGTPNPYPPGTPTRSSP